MRYLTLIFSLLLTSFACAQDNTGPIPRSVYTTPSTIGNSSGGSTTAFGSGSAVIDSSQAPFNIQAGFHAFDCTLTSGSNQVSCTNTTITSNMIGWLFQATNAAGGVGAYTVAVWEFPLNAGAENTITGCVPSCPSKTFTVTQNASATVNPGQSWITVGPDMTSALDTLFLTAYANGTVYPTCPAIYLPGPVIMTKRGQFNQRITYQCSGPYEGAAEKSIAIFGHATFSTQITGTQDFDYTTGSSCPGNFCFGGQGALRLENITFTASGSSSAGFGSSDNLIDLEVDSAMTNVTCMGWGGASVNLTGIRINGVNQPMLRLQADGCGSLGMLVAGTLAPIITDSFIGDNTQNCVDFVPSGTTVWLISTSNGYGGCGSGKDTISIFNGGNFYSTNDVISSTSGCGVKVGTNAGTSTARISNGLILMSGTGNGICGLNSGQIWVSNTNLIPLSGTAAQVVLSNTSKFVSGGGNSISGITLNATTTTLILENTDAVSGTLTNFTPTVTVTGFGTGPTVALNAGINTVERGSVNVTAGTTPAATGTLTLAFNQTYTLGSNAPSCDFIFGDGTGTLTAPVTVKRGTTANVTTTQYQVLWTAGAAVGAGNYNIDWQCAAR